MASVQVRSTTIHVCVTLTILVWPVTNVCIYTPQRNYAYIFILTVKLTTLNAENILSLYIAYLSVAIIQI